MTAFTEFLCTIMLTTEKWDTLTVQEKHDVAAEIIEVVYISHHGEDIEIRFGI